MTDTPSLHAAAADPAPRDPVDAQRDRPGVRRRAGRVAPSAAPSLADKLLIDIPELAYLTSLSVRHLRRLDSSRNIPGRVTVGRRVLFSTEIIRSWVRAGMPDREQWTALQKRTGKH